MFRPVGNDHLSHLLLKLMFKLWRCPRLWYISPCAGAWLPGRKLRFTRHLLNDGLAGKGNRDGVDGVMAVVCAWLAA
jgi:hypothetical protein